MRDLKDKIVGFWDSFDKKEGFKLFSADIKIDLSLGFTDNKEKAVLIRTTDYEIKNQIFTESENIILKYENAQGLYFILKDDFFFGIFVEFIMSILSSVSELRRPAEYVPRIIEIYGHWVAFFNRGAKNSITGKKLLGLLGELIYISEYLKSDHNSHDIIESWEGPYQKSHDFVFNDHDVEIKTKRSGSNNISISSIVQLDFDNPLILGVVNVSLTEENSEGTITILEFIEQIKEDLIVKGYNHRLFLQKLLNSGFNYFDEETRLKLQEKGFVFDSLDYYDVTAEGFPRMLQSDLRKGVTNVSYDLSVSELSDFKI